MKLNNKIHLNLTHNWQVVVIMF